MVARAKRCDVAVRGKVIGVDDIRVGLTQRASTSGEFTWREREPARAMTPIASL